MKELWVEKYRPNTIDGYVFRDNHQKEQVQSWIQQKSIPHLLFSGAAGIGKTTLAKILFNELDVNDLDVLEINASRTNSVDDVRDKIINFVQMIPFGDFKVVLLDEADYLSPSTASVCAAPEANPTTFVSPAGIWICPRSFVPQARTSPFGSTRTEWANPPATARAGSSATDAGVLV